MNLKVAISSGKGGTGKTFISTNIARTLERSGHPVCYLDCDVEEPNGHLFLKPEIHAEEAVTLLSPMEVDADKCIACGKCVTACPVVETIKDADLCVLVTDPTPFGVHDLKLAVDMCREVGQEPVVVVNRSDYVNNDLKTLCEEAGLEILGEIPDDRKIAECYSVGDLVVDKLPEYQSLFEKLADTIVGRAKNPKLVQSGKTPTSKLQRPEQFQPVDDPKHKKVKAPKIHEVVVISGKGGTGKTSLAASFCALEKNLAIADCDVDAADLHLILKPEIRERGWFSGGNLAAIDPDKCTGCGACAEHCRFEAGFKSENFTKMMFGATVVHVGQKRNVIKIPI